jgi:hypothetical protein
MADFPLWAGLYIDRWGAIIASIIGQNTNGTDLFSKYGDFYKKGTKPTLDNLTFVPEYGGFNTRSCAPCLGKDGKPIVFDGPGS